MQLKSEIWVKAYMRGASAAGAIATVVRHGDDDAGAIFVKIRRTDGHAALYGPAPAGLEEMANDRRFALLIDGGGADEAAVEQRLQSERRFDPDVWIIEVEDREGRHFLDNWLIQPPRSVDW